MFKEYHYGTFPAAKTDRGTLSYTPTWKQIFNKSVEKVVYI